MDDDNDEVDDNNDVDDDEFNICEIYMQSGN